LTGEATPSYILVLSYQLKQTYSPLDLLRTIFHILLMHASIRYATYILCTHAHMHTYVHTYIHTHANTQIHIHTYVHAYKQTCMQCVYYSLKHTRSVHSLSNTLPSCTQGIDTAKNIHDMLPYARLVLVLRDPVDRAYSEYQMKVCYILYTNSSCLSHISSSASLLVLLSTRIYGLTGTIYIDALPLLDCIPSDCVLCLLPYALFLSRAPIHTHTHGQK